MPVHVIGLRSLGGFAIPASPNLPNFGLRFNDWVTGKTTGSGGTYTDGIVYLPGGTYFFDPFDLSSGAGVVRAFDASKPNNNWLEFRELDGPGTVTFNMAPDSARAYYGQSSTEAYNDFAGSGKGHGGSFRNVDGTSGSVRWCFNGNFRFVNGTIYRANMDRVLFFGTDHTYPSATWRTHWDTIRSLMGVVDTGVGATIPNTGTYINVRSNDRWKHANEPSAFRSVPATKNYIIRATIHDVMDDGIFSGGGCLDEYILGCLIYSIDNGNNGAGPEAWFHNDTWQITGSLNRAYMYDTTNVGHMQFACENGQVQNWKLDRVWQGISGIVGMDLDGSVGSNFTSTCAFGAGAPTSVISGHYLKGFSNGLDHQSEFSSQSAEGPNNSWANFVNYQGASDLNFTYSGISAIDVPSGVTVDAKGCITSANPTSFIESAEAPHVVFNAAYGTDDLTAVMTDYGLAFD